MIGTREVRHTAAGEYDGAKAHSGEALCDRDAERINAGIERLYDGLKAPALSRYGETTSREDEVI